MHICLKTNNNLDSTIRQLLKSNLSIYVNRYEHASFIRVNLLQFGYSAYLDFQIIKGLRIYSRKDQVEIVIKLEDILTIYDLD